MMNNLINKNDCRSYLAGANEASCHYVNDFPLANDKHIKINF